MNQVPLKQLENWLSVLITSYQVSPNTNVIQCILYYVDRVLKHDDYLPENGTHCLYQAMRKFWSWKINQRDLPASSC